MSNPEDFISYDAFDANGNPLPHVTSLKELLGDMNSIDQDMPEVTTIGPMPKFPTIVIDSLSELMTSNIGGVGGVLADKHRPIPLVGMSAMVSSETLDALKDISRAYGVTIMSSERQDPAEVATFLAHQLIEQNDVLTESLMSVTSIKPRFNFFGELDICGHYLPPREQYAFTPRMLSMKHLEPFTANEYNALTRAERRAGFLKHHFDAVKPNPSGLLKSLINKIK